MGKAQTSYLPGVLVPEVNAGGAAEQAGFKAGDIILRVGNYEVAANNKQVWQGKVVWECCCEQPKALHCCGSAASKSTQGANMCLLLAQKGCGHIA